MLNELYQLSEALEKSKVALTECPEDKIKSLPNESCYKILLNPDGTCKIELIEEKLVPFLRKWEPSCGHSFPGFNIPSLYKEDESIKKWLKKWSKRKDSLDSTSFTDWKSDLIEIRKQCAKPQAKNWDAKTTKKLLKCLIKTPNELREKCGEIPKEFTALEKLFERVSLWKDKDAIELFYELLEDHIWSCLEKGENISFLLSILFTFQNKSRKKEGNNLSVFFDVPDWGEHPVASEKTMAFINERLLQDNAKQKEGEDVFNVKQLDAYGSDKTGCEGTMPEVKLPVLGLVKLRAMSGESPCQRRYGMISANSFPIGADNRKRLRIALDWLGSNEHEGITWGRVGGRELLFAYPTILPEIPPKLIACFGEIGNNTVRFEKCTADVISSLKGSAPLKEVEFRIFALRKMDTARTKVALNHSYSAQYLEDAVKEWQQGCANIPSVQIPVIQVTGKIVRVAPEVPFPLQVSSCINYVHKLNGMIAKELPLMPNLAGIELLLEKLPVSYWLSLIVQNSRGLFISSGNALYRRTAVDSNTLLKLFNVKDRKELHKNLSILGKHKQLIPSILGLLLWKLGIKKEIYMTKPFFTIGRTLKIADDLHVLYCQNVRGSLPSQLLGNALLNVALENPTKALSLLAARIRPYLNWAKTNYNPDNGKLSGYFLKELGLSGSQLNVAELPTKCNDVEKAQIYLGYVSTNEKIKKVNNQEEVNNNQQEENNKEEL